MVVRDSARLRGSQSGSLSVEIIAHPSYKANFHLSLKRALTKAQTNPNVFLLVQTARLEFTCCAPVPEAQGPGSEAM